MRNLLIVLLTVLIVAAGLFLPQLLLGREKLPELDTQYQMVTVTSEDSSDYAWRMQMIGDHYYADRDDLMSSYISGAFSQVELYDLRIQFEEELEKLAERKVISEEMLKEILEEDSFTVNCFYIFDTNDLAGFRIAVMNFASSGWSASITMDLESGKLGRIEFKAEQWRKLSFRPDTVYSWYDIVRGYADYLGLAQAAFQMRPDEIPATEYYEKITADSLIAKVDGSGDAWLETRVLQSGLTTTLCVFQGGR